MPFRPSFLILLLLLAVGPSSRPLKADEVGARLTAFQQNYAAKLAELTRWCEEKKLASAAAQTKSWLPELQPDRLVVYVIDDATRHFTVPPNSSPDEQTWATEFRNLREKAGSFLLSLAGQAVEEKNPAMAWQLLHAAVHEDPDLAAGRTALGYERVGDTWLTPFARQQREQGRIWDDRFGWIPQPDLSRYEQGERPAGQRWISAAEDAAKRKNILGGWQIKTEHYLVTTNHSLEAGAALAKQLETLYQVWQQLFLEYDLPENDWSKLLSGRATSLGSPRMHEVFLYRNKEEYVRDLRTAQPQIDKTIGIYFDTRRRAYFFVGEENYAGNVYHEATHQLFQETRRVPRNIGQRDNFWIVEGIAVYFESLERHEGYCTVGGLEAGRVPAARERLLQDNYYVPFARLTALGQDDIQRDPHIARLYSQAAGQTTFLLNGLAGRYQPAMVRYLTAVYSKQAVPDTLARLTGVSYAELDRQYRAFLQGN